MHKNCAKSEFRLVLCIWSERILCLRTSTSDLSFSCAQSQTSRLAERSARDLDRSNERWEESRVIGARENGTLGSLTITEITKRSLKLGAPSPFYPFFPFSNSVSRRREPAEGARTAPVPYSLCRPRLPQIRQRLLPELSFTLLILKTFFICLLYNQKNQIKWTSSASFVSYRKTAITKEG